jgi:hypothetical protein
MPLTVPDESLATVTEANCYHACRSSGNAWTVLTTERKEQLLREAFDYLRGEYAPLWPADVAFGMKADGVTIETAARDACSLLAMRALAGPLDPELQPQVIESTVGPLTKKYAAATNNGRRSFPDVGRLLGPYLVPIIRGCAPLVRA